MYILNLMDSKDQEPGATKEDGSPTGKALPDVIVYLSSAAAETHRKVLETFRKEDALR